MWGRSGRGRRRDPRGQAWPRGPGRPHLLTLGANEEVGGAVLRGVDHQGVVGGKQPPGPSSLVVLVRVTGSVHFLDACVPHGQVAQGLLWTWACCEQESQQGPVSSL